MTREEIKEGLKFTIEMFKFDPLTGEERTLNDLDATTVNACEEAIKALEQEPTTKNDLAVDCVSRAYLYNRIKGIDHDEDYECDEFGGSRITYHTCDWDEVLREIEDAPSVTPQEPFKPMIEIDLYSVIKQKYIEREVLDKIRAEIEEVSTYDGIYIDRAYVLEIIDKYKAESEK